MKFYLKILLVCQNTKARCPTFFISFGNLYLSNKHKKFEAKVHLEHWTHFDDGLTKRIGFFVNDHELYVSSHVSSSSKSYFILVIKAWIDVVYFQVSSWETNSNLAYDLNYAFLASGSFTSNKYNSPMKTTFTRRSNFVGCKHPAWLLKTCARARFHLLNDAGLDKCSIFSNLQGWQRKEVWFGKADKH